VMEVWNKVDQLPEGIDAVGGIPVSALTGAGIPELLASIDTRLATLFMTILQIKLPATDGERLAWLYRHGTVLNQEEQDSTLYIKVRLTHENAARWAKERKRKKG